MNRMSLDEALDFWHVHEPDMWENDLGPKGWWAVSCADDGIVAYFSTERAAFWYRLAVINNKLNPT